MTSGQRSVLASIALRDLHPDWIPEVDALARLAAVASYRGRRWLAGHLANSTLLFDPSWPVSDEMMPLDHWVYLPSIYWSGMVCGLGALTVGLPTKTDIIAQWRKVLGMPLFAHVWRHRSGPRQASSDVVLSDISLMNWLRFAGARQLYHHATSLHPFVADRVRLAFAPEVSRHRELRVMSQQQVRLFIEDVMTESPRRPEQRLALTGGVQ